MHLKIVAQKHHKGEEHLNTSGLWSQIAYLQFGQLALLESQFPFLKIEAIKPSNAWPLPALQFHGAPSPLNARSYVSAIKKTASRLISHHCPSLASQGLPALAEEL